MKKKILLLFMIFVGLFTITACGSKKEEKEVLTPLLYEVTKEGSTNKIYILGTIHLGNLKNTEFAEYVTKAFESSHYVAAEVDNESTEDEETQQFLGMFYDGEDTIKNHISEETYNKLMKFIDENKLDEGLFNKDKFNVKHYAQSLTQFIIEKSNVSVEEGIDEYFVNLAKKEGKTLLQVESASFQEELLSSLSDKIYENTINTIIDNLDDAIKEAEESFNQWKKGDEEDIWKDDGATIKNGTENMFTEEELKAAKDFDERVLYSRNLSMTDKLEEYFNNNYDVFFMVGQDHVIGDRGIVSYLRQRGYTVTKLS